MSENNSSGCSHCQNNDTEKENCPDCENHEKECQNCSDENCNCDN